MATSKVCTRGVVDRGESADTVNEIGRSGNCLISVATNYSHGLGLDKTPQLLESHLTM